MKWFSQDIDKKTKKEVEEKLTQLDRVILEKCKLGANIIQILSSGKFFRNKDGSRQYSSTDTVKKSILKLEQLGLLIRR